MKDMKSTCGFHIHKISAENSKEGVGDMQKRGI